MIYVNMRIFQGVGMLQNINIYMNPDKLTVILGNWNALPTFCQLHIHLQRFFFARSSLHFVLTLFTVVVNNKQQKL